MAEITTIARPYAKAAFQFSLENDKLEHWSDMLEFASCVAADKQMLVLFNSPGITTDQQAEMFISICAEQLDSEGKNFISQLAENSRLEALPEVARLFELLKAEQEKTVEVSVTSAYEVTPEQADKIAQALKDRLGREVHISSQVDNSLIGGLIIRAGDMVIDGSVRGKLAKLADRLNS